MHARGARGEAPSADEFRASSQFALFLCGALFGVLVSCVTEILPAAGRAAFSSSALLVASVASGTSAFSTLEIVVAHYAHTLDRLNASRVPAIVCDKPDSSPLPAGMLADVPCSLQVNAGAEASSYLAYIASRYESLPDRIAFLHGHQRSNHQRNPEGDLLRAMETVRPEVAFVSLNNAWRVLADSKDDLPSGSPEPVFVSVGRRH